MRRYTLEDRKSIRDMKGLKFYVANTDQKKITLKPFEALKVDTIHLRADSLVYYKDGLPIKESNCLGFDSNQEIANDIGDFLGN